MVRADVVTLVKKSYKSDDIGNQIATESKKEVLCTVQSITRSEFFAAGNAGLKPAYKFIVFFADYNGEDEVEFHGIRYSVYRTFEKESDEIEIYVTEKVGV